MRSYYAKLVTRVWKTKLNLEWWRYQASLKETEVNRLQEAWIQSKEKCHVPRRVKQRDMEQRRFLKRAYEGDEEIFARLPQPTRDSQKATNEFGNNLGGLRDPASAVGRMSILADVGRDVRRLRENFVQYHPHVWGLRTTTERRGACQIRRSAASGSRHSIHRCGRLAGLLGEDINLPTRPATASH